MLSRAGASRLTSISRGRKLFMFSPIAQAGRSLGLKTKLLLLAASVLGASPAYALGTPAGQMINNTAKASYTLPDGTTASVDSNTVAIKVDEVLDVTVVWADGGNVPVQPNSTNRVLTYTVTNTGNGSESFKLTARNSITADDFDPTGFQIYLDTNGNGAFDAGGVDTLYSAGVNDPLLAANASTTVFVVSAIGAQADGEIARMDLVAEALTGTGASGTLFTGAGANGSNAVVGATGADAVATGNYQVAAANVTLVKTAIVADPYGGTSAIPGAVITYTLTATVSGTGSISNVAINDDVPAGSTYKANSLTLQGVALTDAADSDAAEIASSTATFRLGTMGAGQSRTATFKVTINN